MSANIMSNPFVNFNAFVTPYGVNNVKITVQTRAEFSPISGYSIGSHVSLYYYEDWEDQYAEHLEYETERHPDWSAKSVKTKAEESVCFSMTSEAVEKYFPEAVSVAWDCTLSDILYELSDNAGLAALEISSDRADVWGEALTRLADFGQALVCSPLWEDLSESSQERISEECLQEFATAWKAGKIPSVVEIHNYAFSIMADDWRF